MGEIEVNHIFSINAKALIEDHIVNRAGGNIPGHEVSVIRIHFLEEIPGLSVFVSPDPAAFPPGRFRHQAQLVVTRNRGGVNLNKFSVGVMDALLV